MLTEKSPPADSGGDIFTVVYVDDDDLVRQTIADSLCAAGLEVRACRDGLEALDACEAKRPDAVLLDLNMPGLDGFEVAVRLRANPLLKGLRIVALTGRSTWDAKMKAMTAGCDEFLSKPTTQAELVRALRA